MFSQDQRDAITQDFNALGNSKDRAEIDDLAERQEHVYAEFLRRADEEEIYPIPAPHVHTPHEEIAGVAKLSSLLANVGGLFVALLLTSNAAVSRIWGGIGTILLFFAVEFLMKLGIFAIPRKLFMRKLRVMVAAPLTLLFVALTLLLLERFATPELAQTLLKVDAYAWWGLEVALLFLSALAVSAYDRFGWSGRLKQEFDRCNSRIATLKLQIDRRVELGRKVGPGIAVPCFILLCHILTPPAYGCPSVMIDRTGSVANQNLVEQMVSSEILNRLDRIPCLNLVLFSAHPFSDPGFVIKFDPGASHAIFAPIKLARQADLQQKIQRQIENVLSARTAPAECTSIPEILERATLEAKPVLLVTDGLDDCMDRSHAIPFNDAKDVVVVLVRSKGDSHNESAIFRQRKAFIAQYLPNARVFPAAQLPLAVGTFSQSSFLP